MSRVSKDTYKNGKLYNGYDYENQYWVHKGERDTRTLEELQAVGEPKAVKMVDLASAMGIEVIQG